MKLYSIKVGDTKFKVAVVKTPEDRKKGLSGSPKLKEGYGMLFDLGGVIDVTMNMEGMSYPLDIVFISEDMVVKRAVKMCKRCKPVTEANVRYVLEVNAGEAAELMGEKLTLKCKEEKKEEAKAAIRPGVNIIIKIETGPESMEEKFRRGGSIRMREDRVKAKSGKMHVLDDTGRVLMNISGGERIFSIKHTASLIDLAESYRRGDATVEELGKAMQDIINIQDTQEKQYV